MDGHPCRVVFHDQQTAGGSRDVTDGCEHRGDGGGREDVAAHRRVEHALPDVARVRWLVTGAAACGWGRERERESCVRLHLDSAKGQYFARKKNKKTNNERCDDERSCVVARGA